MRWLLPLGLAAAAVGGLLAAVWPDGGERAAVPVSATLTPRAPLFGDRVVARITVPAGTSVETSFRPFTVRSSSRHGTTRVYTLECLTVACVPQKDGARIVRLRPAIVRLPRARPVAIAWPTLRIGSRLSPGDAAQPSYWADTTTPRGTSRLDPAALGWGLTALAAALLLGAGLWTASRLRPKRRQLRLVPAPELTLLEQALEEVERSVDEPAERRRAALDRLALALEDELLARRVRGLAWSESTPEPPAIRLVAHQAREVGR